MKKPYADQPDRFSCHSELQHSTLTKKTKKKEHLRPYLLKSDTHGRKGQRSKSPFEVMLV